MKSTLRSAQGAQQHTLRSGAVLIIVVGLSTTLLTMMVAFLVRMRSTAEHTNPIVLEAQNRLMLHAALMYIQESSRLGWGTETYGWTDIRDGSLGPRPARSASGALPAPSWATSYTPYPDDGGTSDDWPYPGSHVRCNAGVWLIPPCATSPRTIGNIFSHRDLAYGDDAMQINFNDEADKDTFKEAVGQWKSSASSLGMLDTQPYQHNYQTINFDTWRTGSSATNLVKPSTDNRAWFRVYRETLSDHDGIHGGGDPHDDLVVISQKRPGSQGHVVKNWNVFIITCGAGATQGFRNWGEVSDAKMIGHFGSEEVFNELRRRENVSWWRVEWSALQGGGFDPGVYDERFLNVSLKKLRAASTRSQGGNFSWIQRLAREPDQW